MSSGATMVDVLVNTFVPKWMLSAPEQPRQSESNALAAFRQRIYMQQVKKLIFYTLCSILLYIALIYIL